MHEKKNSIVELIKKIWGLGIFSTGIYAIFTMNILVFFNKSSTKIKIIPTLSIYHNLNPPSKQANRNCEPERIFR